MLQCEPKSVRLIFIYFKYVPLYYISLMLMKTTQQKESAGESPRSAEHQVYMNLSDVQGFFTRVLEKAKQIGAKYYQDEHSGKSFGDQFNNSQNNLAS